MKYILKLNRLQKTNLNVVITGGTRGLGKSMVNEFAKRDNVFVISRSQDDIDLMCQKNKKIQGIQCDVSNKTRLISCINDNILNKFDNIDIWINNAGISGGSRKITELDDDKIENIISTNLLGTSICCKNVFEIMKKQDTGGSIFNLAGAGSNGTATPLYSVYGSTKAAIVQLSRSLQKEWKDTNVDLHIISPGMMLTELLLENNTDKTIEFIKFLCTNPDIIAEEIVPKIRDTYYNNYDKQYIKYLTLYRIIEKFISR